MLFSRKLLRKGKSRFLRNFKSYTTALKSDYILTFHVRFLRKIHRNRSKFGGDCLRIHPCGTSNICFSRQSTISQLCSVVTQQLFIEHLLVHFSLLETRSKWEFRCHVWLCGRFTKRSVKNTRDPRTKINTSAWNRIRMYF